MLHAHYDDLLVDITHPYSLVTDLLEKQLVDHCVGNAMLAEHLTMREKMIILVDALITPRAHARARGYVIGRGVYILLYIVYKSALFFGTNLISPKILTFRGLF